MSQKGPEFARDFLTAELALDSYFVAFQGGTFGSVITTTEETTADVEAKSGVSEITEFGRPKCSGSGATAWTVNTASGVTRARNDAAVDFSGENDSGSTITISALAQVDDSSGDSRIKWYVNLASPGFSVPVDRTPQVPASTSDFTTGWVIQEA